METITRLVHGFRHGAITTAIQMQTHVYNELVKGNIISVCFLDVSAGFDTVPHSCINEKATNDMVQGKVPAVKVKSYLTFRTTRVKRAKNQEK